MRPRGEEDAEDLFVRSLMERRERLRLRKSEDETRKRAFDERMRTMRTRAYRGGGGGVDEGGGNCSDGDGDDDDEDRSIRTRTDRVRGARAGERGDDDDGAPGGVVAAIDRDGADGDGDGREGGVGVGGGEEGRRSRQPPLAPSEKIAAIAAPGGGGWAREDLSSGRSFRSFLGLARARNQIRRGPRREQRCGMTGGRTARSSSRPTTTTAAST